jgi:ribosomal-protein-alanine N-acetyltransferase
VEGYARDYLMINGKWEDHIFTSLINPHWRSHL